MPRRSQEHWQAQEQRFLDAARRCFTRLGVDSASMEELRSEAGVSAGAMYRYFPSKDELVHAAIAASMAEVEVLIVAAGTCEAAMSATKYLRAVLEDLAKFRYRTEGVDLFRLAVQGWAYAQTHPRTKAMIQESVDRQLALYCAAAQRWITRAKVHAVATALSAAVIGYVVQSAFADAEISPAAYCEAVALLN